MLHHQVYEDGPQVRAFGVAAQDFFKHGLGSLLVPVLELQPSKFDYQVHICNDKTGQFSFYGQNRQHLYKKNLLTLFIGQTLQRPLEESIGSVALSLTQQEGAVTLPHGLLLLEALHHVLIKVLGFLQSRSVKVTSFNSMRDLNLRWLRKSLQ